MDRHSGILMHISSLPSPYGIGTLGREAYAFADFLRAAGQKYWQLLPLGPTSYGDSPYQSFSTFAGNPYFIDLDLLAEDGLLSPSELEAEDWGGQRRYVDYGRIYAARFGLLRKAFQAGYPRDRAAVEAFCRENKWLDNYALYMALKARFGMKSWLDWPDEDLRLRRAEALERAREELAEDIAFYAYLQYLFFRQWDALREYIHSLGIRIIGDLPIYVAMDSADVWAEPEFFQLGEGNVPTEVSGVPPDYFSADGQLWGNPLYDYDRMKADGYGWWIRRVEGAGRLFDIIRIDHFRGLESYWAVPYGADTAKNGRWRKGPGMDLVGTLTSWFPGLSFIAEDLGFLTPEVRRLLEDSGLPGMKVLEFAFDAREPSNYLPHTYNRHCVCYVGTHDNETVEQWRWQADRADVTFARKYLGLNDAEGFHWGMIRGGMSSVADTFLVQMQDCLGLGAEGRMNTPGTGWGNWRWRLLPGEASPALAKKLRCYTKMYGR
ncbi:MAG: 4-alpha-glucanotransferase [Oscillospiraceae bacterium]|nr:4-alpha-glucanotransferase [Oscillospiraceae bacterium]MCI9562385.1 4-alpha-glucanotransferase [Oscillospiraceae bacterium]